MAANARGSYAAQFQGRPCREFGPDTSMVTIQALYAETLEAVGL